MWPCDDLEGGGGIKHTHTQRTHPPSPDSRLCTEIAVCRLLLQPGDRESGSELGCAAGLWAGRPSQLLMRVRNSSRVLGSSRNTPSMVLVTVLLFIFCTPLITMHMWLHAGRREEERHHYPCLIVIRFGCMGNVRLMTHWRLSRCGLSLYLWFHLCVFVFWLPWLHHFIKSIRYFYLMGYT